MTNIVRRVSKLSFAIACAIVVACGGEPTTSPSPAPSPAPAPSTPAPAPAPGTPAPAPGAAVRLNEDFTRQLYPSDNWWNQDITNAPIDTQSSAYIDFIGRTRTAHPDFGPPP